MMKKITFLLVLTVILAWSCGQSDTEDKSEKASEEKIEMLLKNKQVATLYHELKAENVDSIFTEDFVGRGEQGYEWDRESHKNYLSNGRYKVDSIYHHVAEGVWVTTMFSRTMDYQGERITVPLMHFIRFEGNKIAELWEYSDFNMPDPEEK